MPTGVSIIQKRGEKFMQNNNNGSAMKLQKLKEERMNHGLAELPVSEKELCDR